MIENFSGVGAARWENSPSRVLARDFGFKQVDSFMRSFRVEEGLEVFFHWRSATVAQDNSLEPKFSGNLVVGPSRHL